MIIKTTYAVETQPNLSKEPTETGQYQYLETAELAKVNIERDSKRNQRAKIVRYELHRVVEEVVNEGVQGE